MCVTTFKRIHVDEENTNLNNNALDGSNINENSETGNGHSHHPSVHPSTHHNNNNNNNNQTSSATNI